MRWPTLTPDPAKPPRRYARASRPNNMASAPGRNENRRRVALQPAGSRFVRAVLVSAATINQLGGRALGWWACRDLEGRQASLWPTRTDLAPLPLGGAFVCAIPCRISDIDQLRGSVFELRVCRSQSVPGAWPLRQERARGRPASPHDGPNLAPFSERGFFLHLLCGNLPRPHSVCAVGVTDGCKLR